MPELANTQIQKTYSRIRTSLQKAYSKARTHSTTLSRRTVILSLISLFVIIIIIVLSIISIKYYPGYRLSSLLGTRDYAAAAKLMSDKKDHSSVSKVLDTFSNTYVADACNTSISDSVFISKYADISVLKSELSSFLYKSAHEHTITPFGSGTITAEQCLANIDRIDTFNMLEDTKETLLNETEAIRTSKQGFLEGNEYIKNNDYESALVALNEMIEEDSENYAKLADLKGQWKTAYFDTALAQAKEYFATEQYFAAFNSLSQLNKFLPDEPAVTAMLPEYERKKNEISLQEVSTKSVNHIFTHCLVAYPELSISRPGGGTYDIDCITATEFKRLLNQLYMNNYVLIDINYLYEFIDGKAVKKDTIKIPPGKKPLVFSFDDVVYDPSKTGNGMVDKLVLKNGRIQSYTKMPDGTEIYSIDNEFVPIMDNFVKKHPDFSFNGAKGTICLTGFCGILGYRTHKDSPNRDTEIESVKPVIQKLKDTGWNFASHSYGHYNMPKVSDALFFKDIQQWRDEVESLVGKTYVFVYAFGAWSPYDSEKHQKLMEEGFSVFCGVGSNQYFIQGFPKNDDATDTIFMDRRPIDGFNLRERYANYRSMMDTYTVYDHNARYIKFPKPY